MEHAYSCLDANEEFIQQLKDEEADFKERSQVRNQGGVTKSDKMRRDRAVTELIAVHSLPISIVGSEEFRRCFQTRGVTYVPPGRKRLSRNLIPGMAKKLAEEGFKRLLGESNYSLQLEFDGWSSPGTVALLGIIISSSNGLSFLVDLIDISAERHTARYIADLVLDAVDRLGLPRNRYNNVVTDEASSYRLARELIVRAFSDSHLIEYRCLAHVYNLIGATFSKSPIVKPILSRLAKLIGFLRNKRVAAALENLGANKVVLSVPTRWYSTSLSINSILTIKTSLLALPRNDDLAYETWGPILDDEEFWIDMVSLKRYFDRLSKAIGRAEAHQSKLSNAFADILDFARFVIIESTNDRKYRDLMIESLMIHIGKIDLPLLLAAYALDPHKKLLHLTQQASTVGKRFMLATIFDMGGSDDDGRQLSREYSSYKRIIAGSFGDVGDVEDWWTDSSFGVLKKVAIRLWRCQASSANTERLFSSLGQLMTPLRNRLSLKVITDLLAIKIAKRGAVSMSTTQRRASSASLGSQDSSLGDTAHERRDTPSDDYEIEDKLNELALDEPFLSYPMLEEDVLETAESASGSYSNLSGYVEFNRLINFDHSILDLVRVQPDTDRSSGRTSGQRADLILEEMDDDCDE